MTCTNCGQAWCVCKFVSSNCIAISGNGSQPYRADVNLDPAPNNRLFVTEDGLRISEPAQISRTVAFLARINKWLTFNYLEDVRVVPLRGDGRFQSFAVPFGDVAYDSSGLYDAETGRFTAPRAGLWSFTASIYMLMAEDTDPLVSCFLWHNNRNVIAEDGIAQQIITGTTPSPKYMRPNVELELEMNDTVQAVAAWADAKNVNIVPVVGHFAGAWRGP